MGCASSRFDKRNKWAGDLNTAALNFVGGESHAFDGCPVDRVVLAYGSGELADQFKVDGLKATDEESLKKIYEEAFRGLLAAEKALVDEHGTSDSKKPVVGGKYSAEDARAQLAASIAFLKEKSGITVEDAAAATGGDAAPAEGDGMMAAMEGGDVAMDGGDGEAMMEGMMGDAMEGMAAAMAVESPHKYDGDSYDYAGWQNVPAALLRCWITSEYFGDLVKA